MLGGTPANSVRRVLKVPSDEQPTAKQTSVTLSRHDAAAPWQRVDRDRELLDLAQVLDVTVRDGSSLVVDNDR